MKILYVTTVSNTINAFLIPHIHLLVKSGHHVDVACHIIQEPRGELMALGCSVYNVTFDRSPLSKKNFAAYKQFKSLISTNKYDLVHTHTPVASACARLACGKNREAKVIYTAHGFHFFRGSSYKNWLLYYPIERFLAKYTDVLITINKEDYRISQRFKSPNVFYVPGVGVEAQRFSIPAADKPTIKRRLGLPSNAIVVTSIGEVNENKNHEVAIKALAKIDTPNLVYVICGQGNLERYLKQKAIELSVDVRFLGFRTDIPEILAASDLFVFPSYREGLPVSLMEAMSAGLPIVCSRIRGNSDLVEDGRGGYLVDPDDVNGFADRIQKLVKNVELSESMRQTNLEVIRNFDKDAVIKRMEEIYTALLK